VLLCCSEVGIGAETLQDFDADDDDDDGTGPCSLVGTVYVFSSCVVEFSGFLSIITTIIIIY